MSRSFIIRVERVQEGCTIQPGTVSEPIAGRVLIGRSTEVDFQLNDMSVSREHLLLKTTEEGFSVQNLTRRGSTFVNTALLEGEQTREIKGESAWLQVGQILLKVTTLKETVRISQAMSLPMPLLEEITEGPFIRIQLDPILRIWVGGELVSLFPSAARALTRLCRTPGEAVFQEVLLEAISPDFHLRAGGVNLPQNITYIRDLFEKLMDEDQVSEDVLRALIKASGPKGAQTASDDKDRRGLLRALVSNVRGVGYRLNLPESCIVFEGE